MSFKSRTAHKLCKPLTHLNGNPSNPQGKVRVLLVFRMQGGFCSDMEISHVDTQVWKMATVKLLSVLWGRPGGPYSRYLHKAHELCLFPLSYHWFKRTGCHWPCVRLPSFLKDSFLRWSWVCVQQTPFHKFPISCSNQRANNQDSLLM